MTTDVHGNVHHGAGRPDGGQFAHRANTKPRGTLAPVTTPDALAAVTQRVARAAYLARFPDAQQRAAAVAWEDLGGPEPSDERAKLEAAVFLELYETVYAPAEAAVDEQPRVATPKIAEDDLWAILEPVEEELRQQFDREAISPQAIFRHPADGAWMPVAGTLARAFDERAAAERRRAIDAIAWCPCQQDGYTGEMQADQTCPWHGEADAGYYAARFAEAIDPDYAAVVFPERHQTAFGDVTLGHPPSTDDGSDVPF